MYEFEDGTKVWKIISDLKLIVEDSEAGKFEISGFKDSTELDNFLMFGDFSRIDNDYFINTGYKSRLVWTSLD